MRLQGRGSLFFALLLFSVQQVTAQGLPDYLCPAPGRWITQGISTLCQCPNGHLLNGGEGCNVGGGVPQNPGQRGGIGTIFETSKQLIFPPPLLSHTVILIFVNNPAFPSPGPKIQ